MPATPRRQDAVTAFRNGLTRVLLGTPVLEYGLNLQWASTLVSVGLSCNAAVVDETDD